MIGGLLRHLTPEMLLLWDRGFFSYGLWKEVTVAGREDPGAGDRRVDPRADPQPGRRLVSGQDLSERLTTAGRIAMGSSCG